MGKVTEVDTVSHRALLWGGILEWGAYGLVFLILGPGGDITSLEALFIAYTPHNPWCAAANLYWLKRVNRQICRNFASQVLNTYISS